MLRRASMKTAWRLGASAGAVTAADRSSGFDATRTMLAMQQPCRSFAMKLPPLPTPGSAPQSTPTAAAAPGAGPSGSSRRSSQMGVPPSKGRSTARGNSGAAAGGRPAPATAHHSQHRTASFKNEANPEDAVIDHELLYRWEERKGLPPEATEWKPHFPSLLRGLIFPPVPFHAILELLRSRPTSPPSPSEDGKGPASSAPNTTEDVGATYLRFLEAESEGLANITWHPASKMGEHRKKRILATRGCRLSKSRAMDEFKYLGEVLEEVAKTGDGDASTKIKDLWSQCWVYLRPAASAQLQQQFREEQIDLAKAYKPYIATSLDLFRLARHLSVEEATPLSHVEELAKNGDSLFSLQGEETVSPTFGFPSPADRMDSVLQVALTFPQYIELSSQKVVKVSEEPPLPQIPSEVAKDSDEGSAAFLPPPPPPPPAEGKDEIHIKYRMWEAYTSKFSPEELEAKVDDYTQKLKSMPSGHGTGLTRMKFRQRRIKSRCFLYGKANPTVYQDPNVSAVYLYDALPSSGFHPITLASMALCREEVMGSIPVINSRAWIYNYPKLFHLIELGYRGKPAPKMQDQRIEFGVQRAELPRARSFTPGVALEGSLATIETLRDALMEYRLRSNPANCTGKLNNVTNTVDFLPVGLTSQIERLGGLEALHFAFPQDFISRGSRRQLTRRTVRDGKEVWTTKDDDEISAKFRTIRFRCIDDEEGK